MIPTLPGTKVTLSPFTQDDAPLVQQYAGDPAVARTTLNIPHPYPDGEAEKWIASHLLQFLENRNVVFAIRAPSGEFCGAINLALHPRHRRGELGYWIGVPFWGQGFCTDAARTVIRYGFETFSLNKIYACHAAGNVASGRVMEKSGMSKEGCLTQHVVKDGVPIDIVEYGLLRSEYREG